MLLDTGKIVPKDIHDFKIRSKWISNGKDRCRFFTIGTIWESLRGWDFRQGSCRGKGVAGLMDFF